MSDVLIIHGQPILRRGIVASLAAAEGIGGLEDCASIAEAWRHPALVDADVLLLDASLPGATDFVVEVLEMTTVRVVTVMDHMTVDTAHALLNAGAVATLNMSALTPAAIIHAVRAAVSTHGPLVSVAPRPEPRLALSDRERRVLAMLAEGHPTREVALELSYSERTVKKVISDATLKLGGRSRTHAIAEAVRNGLI